MQTSPRARGDEPNAARQSAESTPPATDGPRLFHRIPPETVQRRTAAKQKKLRAMYRRETRRHLDAIMAVDAKAAAGLFDLSERAWRRLDVTGQVPPPIRVGRSVRWRLKELAAWVRAGCPDREAWEAMRDD